jgi:hypothetical protein
MSNYAKMYWLTRLDKLNTIFVLFLLAGVVLSGLVIIAWLSRDDKDSITTEVLKKLKGIKRLSGKCTRFTQNRHKIVVVALHTTVNSLAKAGNSSTSADASTKV